MLEKLDSIVRKLKLDHLLITHTRINSKWVKDLSITLEITKILGENLGSKSQTLLRVIFFPIYHLRQGKQKKNK